MRDETFDRLRRRYRRDRVLRKELEQELRAVARAVIRHGGLPDSYAPGGVWNVEAEADAYQSWFERRLTSEGQLLALLDRARGAAGFRGLAERSFRQHLSNSRDRTVSQNLYRRVADLLGEDSTTFERFRPAKRRQDEWWGLRGWHEPPEFVGRERDLLAAAWGLGEFAVIRYAPGARKLAPVLQTDQLHRFLVGLLEAASATLTLTLMMEVLGQRFQLDDPNPTELDDTVEAVTEDPGDMLGTKEMAVAVLGDLTERQAEVLIAADQHEPMADTAERLGCSLGTVSNERARAAEAISRATGDDSEYAAVLKKLLDLLYEAGEGS
jgi:DNA-directed RNA polymerase specialized sigma24 family protein